MAITVERSNEISHCNSQCERHRGATTIGGIVTPAVLSIAIGDSHSHLCEPCAMSAFNALGFMLASVTGKTLPQLVGLKPARKAKS